MQSSAKCHHCGYSLHGLRESRCPECGTAFDPDARSRHRLRLWLVALVIMIVGVVRALRWLLFVHDDPGYVRSWINRWPILPGLVPTHLVAALIHHRPFDHPVTFALMAMITLGALADSPGWAREAT